MKNMVNDNMEYFFGLPQGRYTEVLEGLGHTNVNSCQMSSIPLAEFWQPANLDTIESLLLPELPGLNLKSDLKFFEFPTPAMCDGKEIGRPSMTDLMILSANWQIAIEGKMKEYLEGDAETIREWLEETGGHAGKSQRPEVLRAWFGYLAEAGCTGLDSFERLVSDCGDVGYQFLHRTASACNKANGTEGRVPVLVYQLFFDNGSGSHRAKMNGFRDTLREWAERLRLRKMKFLVLTVPVANYAEVWKRFGRIGSGIFRKMEREDIYRFRFDGIEVDALFK